MPNADSDWDKWWIGNDDRDPPLPVEKDATEWAIAQVESHPVRSYTTLEVTGYMLTAREWRTIRAALRSRLIPPE